MQQQPGYNVQPVNPAVQPIYPAVQPIYPAVVQQPDAPQQVVVMTSPSAPATQMTVIPLRFGDQATNIICGSCGAKVFTTTRPKSGLLAWLLCGLSLFIGCWAGCCLIPFCIDRTRDVEHFCPQCNALLGVHKRL